MSRLILASLTNSVKMWTAFGHIVKLRCLENPALLRKDAKFFFCLEIKGQHGSLGRICSLALNWNYLWVSSSYTWQLVPLLCILPLQQNLQEGKKYIREKPLAALVSSLPQLWGVCVPGSWPGSPGTGRRCFPQRRSDSQRRRDGKTWDF